MRRSSAGWSVLSVLGCLLVAAFFVLGRLPAKFDLLAPDDAVEQPSTYSVGVAQTDITPAYPVRLNGFGFRKTESEGITTPIWAKALAISDRPTTEPVVLVTVENLGVPAAICDEVAKRLEAKTGLKRSRLSVTSSHTHTGPMIRGVTPTIFGSPIPDDQWKQIDRYTAELTDHLEQVALAALNDRQPSRLTWGIGSVKFAANRRTKGGVVDHDLPLLAVKGLDGVLRAIYVNYACHGVTLSNNKISGDWIGYAQDLIQREFPTAVALVSIGCGADQNPSSGVSGDKTDFAIGQGSEIAAEAKRLLSGYLAPIHGAITTQWTPLTLEFAAPLSHEQWQERAKKTDAVGYHARVQLERLARGEKLPTQLDYPIASWMFGDSLAMVFLPGEVVVDYSLRLKKELDGRRLWINGYSNDVPCYIPSDRVLSEGGYEAGDSSIYFDRPAGLKAGSEAKIVEVVHRQLQTRFSPPFDPNKTNGSLPKSPQQSLATLQTTSNLRVDLVVAEPLVSDPVAIDFAADGSLWVAEMCDYPMGLPRATAGSTKGRNGQATSHRPAELGPGGRVRLVRDRDGDGQFDSSTIFLDNIPFPTGVTVWRGGVLVCAAPDILYAEDTDGDDKADIVKKLFSGFDASNIQARLNSLSHGLDGWIHGSCGLAGGTITNFKHQKYELGYRDFRIKPDTGEIEAATGRTQQGLARDDFGNWFGCDNLNLAFHYPMVEHYLKRNPYIASPPSRVNITQSEESRRLFPSRADAQRFQLSGAPGTITAACGLGVYRDSQLGPDYFGNLFVCEPVNLLVHRLLLKPRGSSFTAERAPNEAQTEFLRSSDSWFRPVQAVTGPDGALWVVDMYRFIIEDPRWIPEAELAPLDVRAGSSLGRIYRVRNATDQTPPAARSSVAIQNDNAALNRLRNSSVYRELEIESLEEQAEMVGAHTSREERTSRQAERKSPDPATRMNAYRKADAGGWLVADDVTDALKDPYPGIRAFGLLLAEKHLPLAELPAAVAETAHDESTHVRLQAAFSLGQWDAPEVGPLLAKLALKDAEDPYLVAAVFSSVTPKNLTTFTTTLLQELQGREPPSSLMTPFLATAVGYSDDAAVKLALTAVAVKGDERPKPWQLNAITNLLESLSKRSKVQATDETVAGVIHRMENEARKMLVTENREVESLSAAINLLGRDPSQKESDTASLAQLLSSAHPPELQVAAVEALERIASDTTPTLFSEHFRELSPSVQPRVIDALMSRDKWFPQLFAALSQGTIPPAAMTAAQRQELVGHPDAAVRDRANALLATSFNSDRSQVIHQYHAALELTGDPEKGRAVFGKTCSQCHRLGDLGYSVGPNLAMVATKTPSFILQEILDPNRNVDARYISYVAITKSGLTRTGILSNESSSNLTLLNAEAKKFTLSRQELEELRASGKSLMPEGLERDLTPQAAADLIAFLRSVPAMSKHFEGNTPMTVKPVAGRLSLLASTASIIGDQITFEKSFDNIGFWRALQDHVFWTADLPEPAVYDVYMEYACDSEAAGNGYLLEAAASSLSGHVQSTGGWDKYAVAKLGSVSLAAGPQRIVLRPDGAAMHGALVDLRGLYFVPTGDKFSLEPPMGVDVATIASRILDDKLTEEQREAIVAQYPSQATELVVAMTHDMPNDTTEEYRRIPWIWRVAVACGKRDQIAPIQSLLNVSLPTADQPLKDWQAVVVGGGIINGIGLTGGWPRTRMDDILKDQPDLQQRWQRTLDLSAIMTEDERINTGTRYDAMRIIALDERLSRREQLIKYLPKGTHDELQMGAISGLSDIDFPDVARLLIENVGHFNEENRGYAMGALVRFDARIEALLDALADGRVPTSFLTDAQKMALRESKNRAISERAIKVLGP